MKMCEIFHCDHRGDRYCCYFCDSKDTCRNPCQNNPYRCGKFFEKDEQVIIRRRNGKQCQG